MIEKSTVTRPSQEDLLGYLLGALDAEQERAVQQSIDNNPTLEQHLVELKATLIPLELLRDSEPAPPGLARRTCETIAAFQTGRITLDKSAFNRDFNRDFDSDATTVPDPSHSETLQTRRDELPTSPSHPSPHQPTAGPEFRQTARRDSDSTSAGRAPARMSPTRDPLRFRSWSFNDFLVATVCVGVLVGLLVPAISYTRYFSQRAACQSNLIFIGKALQEYSDIHGGKFVPIPTDGNLAVSGVFAPVLKESGLLPDDSLLACAGTGRSLPIHVPSTDAILNSEGERLAYLHQTMSGDYGYTLGYLDGDTYMSPENLGRARFVIVADRPSGGNVGFTSQNHRGVGQNCLFEDGHWEFVAGYSYGEDAIYTNDFNLVSAGANRDDIVIGASHCRPVFAHTAAHQ